MSDAGDRELAPTPRRRQEARRQGQVARSRELANALLMLGGIALLWWWGDQAFGELRQMARSFLDLKRDVAVAEETAVEQSQATIVRLVQLLAPLLGGLVLLALSVNAMQTGWLFLPQKVSPDFSRVNPLSGLRRIFRLEQLAQMPLAVLKVAVVIAVAFACVATERDRLLSLGAASGETIGSNLVEFVLNLGVKVAASLVVVGLLDYGIQRWLHERRLRMTPDELRDELRAVEGDPQIESRRRQRPGDQQANELIQLLQRAALVIHDRNGHVVVLARDEDSPEPARVIHRSQGQVGQSVLQLARNKRLPVALASSLTAECVRCGGFESRVPELFRAEIVALIRGASV